MPHSRLVTLVESEALLCPSCAARPVDSVVGFCSACVIERMRENYVAADHRAVGIRVLSWSARSTQPDVEVVKLRQQRSRLRRIVQPHEPAPADVDPWLLAEQAVRALARVRSALPRSSTRVDDLERAVELVRQLAWGPDD